MLYTSLPDTRWKTPDPDERRLFYVGATRAKQELVVLDGGKCGFVSELQIETTDTVNTPPVPLRRRAWDV